MGIRLSLSTTITSTGASTLFAVPDPYIAFLKRLSISNGATALATVQIIHVNETFAKPVLTLKIASGATIVLKEEELPTEAFPTAIALSTDQQPLNVDYSVELE
jgi:hypothetical protein